MKNEQWYQDLSVRNANGDYAGIISAIAKSYLNVPSYFQYISLHYCLAMAFIGQGDMLNGISQLRNLQAHNVANSSVLDFEGKNLAARINRQLTLLEGFTANGLFYKKNEHLTAATEIFYNAMQENDQALAAAAGIVMNQWCQKNVAEEIYYIPNSPTTLQIEPTNACNLKCTMCPREKMKRTTGFLDINLFRSILNSWSNKCVTLQLEHLIFGGMISARRKGTIKLYFMGEPLLHSSLSQMIKIAKQEGCFVTIQTNGVLLSNRSACENLLNAKPNSVGISIDGMNESTYEKVRQGSSYQTILNNIENLYYAREKLGLSKEIGIGISTIIANYSEDTIKKASSFLKPMSQFVDEIAPIFLTRNREPVFFDNEGNMKIMKVEQRDLNSEAIFCREPLEKLNVLWNGDITPCSYDIDGVWKLGRVQDGIDNVWGNEKIIDMHNAILNKDPSGISICRQCRNIVAE